MFLPMIASEVVVIVFSSLNCEWSPPFPPNQWELIYDLMQPCTLIFGHALSIRSAITCCKLSVPSGLVSCWIIKGLEIGAREASSR